MKTETIRLYVCLTTMGIVCLLSPTAFAAVDSTAGNAGFQYLDVPPAPRQIALGWAGTALGENGFAFYNPASPAIDKTTSLSLGFAPMPYDYSIAHAQGSCMISSFFVGANITNHVVSGIYPTNYNHDPDYNTPFSYNGSMVSVNAGYMRDRLSIGLTINGLQEQIGASSAYGISASAGLTYTASGNVTIGVAGLHLGTSTGFTDDTKSLGKGYALPRSGRAGVAYTDTLYRVPFTLTGDIVYRDVGVKGTPIAQRVSRLTVPLGIEVWPTSYVAVRLGKRLNYDSELFTFGAGLRWSMLTFDMAFVLARLVTDIQVQPFFGLTYALRPTAQDIAKVKHSTTSRVIIDKPAEIKSTPATAPLDNKVRKADTTAAMPSADTSAHGAAVEPAGTPQAAMPDSTVIVPQAPVLPNPVEQNEKNAPADSVRTKQPVVPAAPASPAKQ
jgi:hypothetical protein